MPTPAVIETDKYFYVVHGVIPEVMPNVAYRRACGTREQQFERKILKCPFCAMRLTDTDVNTKVELYRHPERVGVPCQLYLKCFYCKKEIGIIIAGIQTA